MVALITSGNLDIARKMGKLVEIRHLSEAYSRFWVSDDKESFLTVSVKPPPGYRIGVLGRGEDFALMLKNFFECAWRLATPLAERINELEKAN